MMIGLGDNSQPQMPGQPKPFMASGNPILDAINRGDLSHPLAQQAVVKSGILNKPTPEPPMPGAQPTPSVPSMAFGPPAISHGLSSGPAPPPPPESPAVSEMHRTSSAPLPTQIPRIGAEGQFLRMQPNALAHTSADTGRSGIGQIHNPVARHGLEALDAIGSAFLPGITSMLPGTELHHRGVVAGDQSRVAEEETLKGNEAKRGLESAQTEQQLAQAGNLKSETEQRGQPIPKAGDPTKTIETADGIMQFNPDSGKYDIPVGDAPGKNATQHVVAADGSVIAIKTDSKTGETTHEVVYHGDPKVETQLTDLQVGGKPHTVIVDKRTGATIRDLGESGIKPAAVNVNTQANSSYEKRNAELTAIGKPIADMNQRLGRLQDTLSQNTPQANALVAPELLTVMAGGIGSGLRMNEAEIARIVGGRSKWQSLQASINKWRIDPAAARSITPEQQQQIHALVSTVADKLNKKQGILNEAYKSLAGTDDVKAHREIVNGVRTAFSEVDTAGAGGEEAQPKLNDTKQYNGRNYRFDGKEWVAK